MATLHIAVRKTLTTFATISDGSVAQQYPVPISVPLAKQSITTSGSSQASSISADPGYIWDITVTGGNVYLKFGSSPTAAAGDDTLLLDGQTRQFGVSAASEKVAVINAS